MSIEHTPQCRAHHMGLYAMVPEYLEDAVSQIRAGLWKPWNDQKQVAGSESTEARPGRLSVTNDGIGLVVMSGAFVKGASKYSNADTTQARRMIREAARDDSVRGILLLIDSPGGMLAGTEELGRDIAMAAQAKPTHAHIDDLGASAAYWAASQASFITANATAEIGSIGVYAVVTDRSKQAEMEGIKVHVVSTGPNKGALVPGTEVTDDQLAMVQESVSAAHGHFLAAVHSGRGLEGAALDAASTGRVWKATEAMAMGLIDQVAFQDDAVGILRAQIERGDRMAKARRVARVAKMRERSNG